MEGQKAKRIASRLLADKIDSLIIYDFINEDKLNGLNEADKNQVLRFATNLLESFQEKLDFDPELTLQEEISNNY